MNKSVPLSVTELKSEKPGEGLTVAAVMAVLVASIVAVIVYRLFISKTGSAALPGGFKFTWK
jgi:hypothetical protein